MTESKMIALATKIAKCQGVFLLAYDIIGSKAYRGERRQALMSRQEALGADLSREFAGVMPATRINTLVRDETGFQIIVGDASWAGVSDPQAIPQIIAYAG